MAIFFDLLGLIILLEIFFILFAFWTIGALFFTKVPFARTPKKNIAEAFSRLKLPPRSKIYDLGCGDAGSLFLAEKLGYCGTGYELSPYPYFRAMLKKLLTGSEVRIFRSNFFKADLSRADAVFVFLISTIMGKVGEKLKKELKPGTPVISYGFQIPGWQAVEILDSRPSKTYIYHT